MRCDRDLGGNDAQAYNTTLQFPNTSWGQDPWSSGMTLNGGLWAKALSALGEEQGLSQEKNQKEKVLSFTSRGSCEPSYHQVAPC